MLATAPPVVTVAHPAQVPDAPGGLDPAVRAEQRRVAALQPKRNPFSPVSGPAPADTPRVVASAAPPAEDSLVLDGIIFSKAAERRSAIINGKMLGEGKTVGGYTIVTINAGDVVLEKGTRRITLQPKR